MINITLRFIRKSVNLRNAKEKKLMIKTVILNKNENDDETTK